MVGRERYSTMGLERREQRRVLQLERLPSAPLGPAVFSFVEKCAEGLCIALG